MLRARSSLVEIPASLGILLGVVLGAYPLSAQTIEPVECNRWTELEAVPPPMLEAIWAGNMAFLLASVCAVEPASHLDFQTRVRIASGCDRYSKLQSEINTGTYAATRVDVEAVEATRSLKGSELCEAVSKIAPDTLDERETSDLMAYREAVYGSVVSKCATVGEQPLQDERAALSELCVVLSAIAAEAAK